MSSFRQVNDLSYNTENCATDYEALSLAHRVCWKYKESDKGPTYTFDKDTMLEFVRLLRMMDGK